MNVGIYIYDDAEVLDFSGPFEVFSTATRVAEASAPFSVFLIAEAQRTIQARGGYLVQPHYGIDDHPALDLLIVVGGVHLNEMKNRRAIAWIRQQADQARLVASVCTGAFLLAEAGVLTHQRVTTHWEDIPDLRSSYPELTVVEEQRWVDDGEVVTSGGISAGIDMSLYLVGRLASPALAEKTARQMEYDWVRS